MKIKETLNFFLNLKNDSVEKSEIKVYDKYIEILSDLKNRDLTQNQIQSIESELEVLNLNIESDNRKKHFTKKLTEFEKFKRQTFINPRRALYELRNDIWNVSRSFITILYWNLFTNCGNVNWNGYRSNYGF